MKTFKLGKKPKRIDARTFRLDRYLPTLPPVPVSVDWSGNVGQWFSLLNDAIGDCVIAASGHAEMLWTSLTSAEFVPTDAQIQAAYTAITGYDPSQTDAGGNNPTDQGTDVLTALNYWRKTGIAGRNIYSFAEVTPTNLDQVRASIAFFGGLFLGVNFPQSAMDSTNANLPWTTLNDANTLGGHCVWVVEFDALGLTCITWGQKQKMSWDWFEEYADEAYVLLSSDFINSNNGLAPSGFNLTQLQTDLQSL